MNRSRRLKSERPIAIDLFAGAGGLTEGLKWAGFRVVGAVEKDPIARLVYSINHPEVSHVWEAIEQTPPDRAMYELGLDPGDLDLLAGCPPCQGFSRVRTLNKATAVEDQRNGLIFYFLAFVEVLRPKALMLENVPSLAKDARFQAFPRRLADLGYYVGKDSMDILDAANFGVPQRRKRLLLMTSRLKRIPFAPVVSGRVTVRQAIGGLKSPPDSGDPLHDLPERRSARVLRMIKNIPSNGGSRRDLPHSLRLACHERTDGFSDVYGRMSWDDVAPTITAGCYHPSKGRFLHPEQHRTITMREAALLQGFPSTYTFPTEIGKVRIASLIGNALPPPFVMHQAKMIRDVLASASIMEHDVRDKPIARVTVPVGG